MTYQDTTTTTATLLSTLSGRFRRFADECRDSTPFYADLTLKVADDAALLEALMIEDGELIRQQQPLTLMLFGAVNYLSRRYSVPYPGLDDYPAGDPYPAFRAFCMAHRDALRNEFRTRIVQTNEVGRSALLLPAFTTVAARFGGQPFALIEIGASAGLNLLWDHYGYRYVSPSDATPISYGNPESALQLTCESRGEALPLLSSSATLPTILSRCGIDLNPINLQDPDAVAWLEALCWVEQRERAQRLHTAIQIARNHSQPHMLQGSVFDLLTQACAEIPAQVPLCLYHTFTIYQFTPEMREQFTGLIAAQARLREHLAHVSIEWLNPAGLPELRLARYQHSVLVEDTLLAQVDYHGRWMTWL